MSEIEYTDGDSRIEYARGLYNEGLCPGEWVARYGHKVGCWSLDEAVYSDLKLRQWVREVTQFLQDGEEVRHSLREKYLTQEEIKRVEEDEGEF